MSDSVTVQMEEILNEYNSKVKKVADDVMKDTAKEAAKMLRNTSPVQRGGKRSGRYARGWRVKEDYGAYIVYNATDWQLTHLLENGHDVVNRYGATGARAGAIKHIEPVEEWAISEVPVRISRGLE